MSRIGNRILDIPQGVNVSSSELEIKISGSNGNINIPFNKNLLSILIKDNKIFVKRKNEDKETKMIHGTINSLIKNALDGVSKNHIKSLKIVGVGYKANVLNGKIELLLGYSHPIKLDIPKDVKLDLISPTEIKIYGPNKQSVGEFAAIIRSKRPPEPYQGKGVMYVDEHILRKVGKTAESSKK